MTPPIRTLGPGTDVDALVARSRAAGRAVSVVRAGAGKRATIDAFARALDFPSWHGHNLDALADCLGDWAERTPGEQEVVLDHAASLRAHDAAAAAGIGDVLADLVRDHPHVHVSVVDR